MAHYAFLDESNVVTEVITGIDENELIEGLHPEIWYGNFREQNCKRTSINAHAGKKRIPGTNEMTEEDGFRKNYAIIGGIYDESKDAFIGPQPYPSWTLNETTFMWDPPVPRPDYEGSYVWNEESLSWE